MAAEALSWLRFSRSAASLGPCLGRRPQPITAATARSGASDHPLESADRSMLVRPLDPRPSRPDPVLTYTSLRAISSSAIWIAFNAAPLRRLSLTSQNAIPLSTDWS